MPAAPASRPATSDPAVLALEVLAAELTARGWIARLHTPPGRRPSLFTQNPDPGAAALSEHIMAASEPDGKFCFWWPWAERIAPAMQAGPAADVITRVLRATDAEQAR